MRSVNRQRQPKFFFFALAWAFVALVGPICIGEERHDGYLESVTQERRERLVELLMVTPPPRNKAKISDIIFETA